MAKPARVSAKPAHTIDPTQIQAASQIPPPGSQLQGSSPQGIVDVYYGTITGDIDAKPAAAELLATAPDTGGLANADYIYNQVSALYGKVQLPEFQSPSGKTIKSLIFVSGSKRGGYGAFHLSSSQADFDRIVVDSLNSSGDYSSGSALLAPAHAAIAPGEAGIPHLFPMFRGEHGLLGVVDPADPALKSAAPAAMMKALAAASQSRSALAKSIESHSYSAVPTRAPKEFTESSKPHHGDVAAHLARANRNISSLMGVAASMGSGRQHLSTALFAAEIIESFENLTGKGDAGKTDGEAVSRVVSFKLAPEIALVPGFNSQVTQQWWADGHPDFVNDNSQTDQSTDGNAAGVMFLEFLTDYLGVPMDTILGHMPTTGGAPLGLTYVALLQALPALGPIAGADGTAAFQKMISLLTQNTQSADGTLNLPADGNPFPTMPNSKQGGLFA
jgi:hypothetical protein